MNIPLSGILGAAVWGGLASADQRALGGRQIHQPLVAAAGAGVILGEPVPALLAGLWFQLVWIAPMPVGGRILPDSGACTVAAAVFASAIPGPFGFGSALLFGLMIAAVSVPWERALRSGNQRREERSLLSSEPGVLRRAILLGVAGPFLRGCLCVLSSGILSAGLRPWLSARALPAPAWQGSADLLLPVLLLAAVVLAARTLLPRIGQASGRSGIGWILAGLLIGAGGRFVLEHVTRGLRVR